MTLFPDDKSGLIGTGIFIVAGASMALFLTFLSIVIIILEYTIGNFGDSDMPPYQPDTPFEKHWDEVWYAVTIGAAGLWLGVIVVIIYAFIYAITLFFRAWKRRVIQRRAGAKPV